MQKSQEKSINNYNPNFSGLKKTEKQMNSPNPSFGYEKDEDWHQWLRCSLMKRLSQDSKQDTRHWLINKQFGVDKDRIRLNIESH